MKLDLIRLRNNIDQYIDIDIDYAFSKEELKNTEIISLDDLKIIGDITKTSIDNYYLNIEMIGTMILPCSVTLKPVNYPFKITINGNLLELMQEIDENVKKIENTIDIFPIIWENILMEIPMKVVSDDISDVPKEGMGWKFIDESDLQ